MVKITEEWDEILKEEEIEKEVKPARTKKNKDLDFSHVKSVIKRLSAMDLTPADRREIKELELAVFSAEKGGEYPLLKEKINDGLGFLLKLMAKYGA